MDDPLGKFLWFLPTQMMQNDHNLSVTIVRQIEIKSQNPDQKLSQHERQSQIAIVRNTNLKLDGVLMILIKPLLRLRY